MKKLELTTASFIKVRNFWLWLLTPARKNHTKRYFHVYLKQSTDVRKSE